MVLPSSAMGVGEGVRVQSTQHGTPHRHICKKATSKDEVDCCRNAFPLLRCYAHIWKREIHPAHRLLASGAEVSTALISNPVANEQPKQSHAMKGFFMPVGRKVMGEIWNLGIEPQHNQNGIWSEVCEHCIPKTASGW